MTSEFESAFIQPGKALSDFVACFWMVQNPADSDKEIVILPDGRIDLILSQSPGKPFKITLSGIETRADGATMAAGARMFAVSFKLLATEYIFQHSIADLLNYAKYLPDDFWHFSAADLGNFENFCNKASEKIQVLIPKAIDNRKQRLFDLIYASEGAITVKELSEKVFWSSRQMNRYFNQQFGLSVKTYCNILRFRASFGHIKEGKLFPQQNFADQSHFIKEVRRMSGVSPKELNRNPDGRFIQFSTLLTE